MSFRYERPDTLAQATALLAEAGAGARILAGGTDLMIALRGGPRPTVLVDIKRIPELGTVIWTPAGDLEIGACVRVQDVAEDARIREVFTALAEGAEAIGSLQIRWRATVAGNLSNASPCMDTAPPLLVLNGRLRVVGPQGHARGAARGLLPGRQEDRARARRAGDGGDRAEAGCGARRARSTRSSARTGTTWRS